MADKVKRQKVIDILDSKIKQINEERNRLSLAQLEDDIIDIKDIYELNGALKVAKELKEYFM